MITFPSKNGIERIFLFTKSSQYPKETLNFSSLGSIFSLILKISLNLVIILHRIKNSVDVLD